MALQTSGAISLNDIHVEAGGTSGTTVSMNDADVRGLISKASGATMSFSEWYGASNTFTFTISSNTANANLSSLATAAGWDGSAALQCTVGSGVYVYSTSTGTAGFTVNVANATVINNGYIMGMGGAGAYNANGSSGGTAINITASGTTIGATVLTSFLTLLTSFLKKNSACPVRGLMLFASPPTV